MTVQRATTGASARPLVGSRADTSYRPMLAARSPLPHLPALDGLRGLAIVAVLLFHTGWRGAAGGFLGVSTFFTLSGYLITARLVHDHRQTGRVDLAAFWARRVRRLVPAAVGAVALVVVLAAWVVPSFRANLIGDVAASLGEVANWRFWSAGRAYPDLFRQPSPLLHFWSLAIEEQFYVVFPVLAWLVLVVAGRPPRALAKVVGALVAACTVTALWAGFTGHTTLAYYGTPMRAGEILAGSALALSRFGRATNVGTTRRASRLPAAALVACVGLWAVATTRQAWVYRGGFAVYSALSVAVIAGVLRPGPVRRWLSWRPLRWLGRISYGVYLYHWPLYLWLSPAHTRLTPLPLFALRAAAAVAAAVLSYHLVEQPILRHARFGWRRARRFAVPLLATMASIVVAAVVIAGGHQPSTAAGLTGVADAAPDPAVPAGAPFASTVVDDPATATAPASTASTASAASPAPLVATTDVPATTDTPATTQAATTTTAAPAPTRITLFGDSTAMLAAKGLMVWGDETGVATVDGSGARLGCGIGRGGRVRIAQYGEGDTNPECDAWPTRWPAVVAKRPADIGVVMIGPWDVTDRQMPGDTVWRSPGDPVYDAYLKHEMEDAVDLLTKDVPTVVWLTNPLLAFGRGDPTPPETPYPVSEPARTARYNELLHEVAAERPALHLVDLAAWMRTLPGGELDPAVRPDGVHLSKDGAIRVARWLGPELLKLVGRDAPAAAT